MVELSPTQSLAILNLSSALNEIGPKILRLRFRVIGSLVCL